MSKQDTEHTLAFLLDFDGRVHWYTGATSGRRSRRTIGTGRGTIRDDRMRSRTPQH